MVLNKIILTYIVKNTTNFNVVKSILVIVINKILPFLLTFALHIQKVYSISFWFLHRQNRQFLRGRSTKVNALNSIGRVPFAFIVLSGCLAVPVCDYIAGVHAFFVVSPCLTLQNMAYGQD
jgi:hypothetical protein